MDSNRKSNMQQPSVEPSSPSWIRPVILVAVVFALFFSSRLFDLGEKLVVFRVWIESLGARGYWVFLLVYVASTVAAVPGSAMTVLAGSLFGSLAGVILVSIASTTGATLSFLIARYFARESVSGWLSKKQSFQRLERLTKDHGPLIVAFTRLIPIFPFNILNYGFGLTRVNFIDYVFWSWLCMLPGTILYVVGADVVATGLMTGRIPWTLVIITFSILAFFIVIVKKVKGKFIDRNTGTTVSSLTKEDSE